MDQKYRDMFHSKEFGRKFFQYRLNHLTKEYRAAAENRATQFLSHFFQRRQGLVLSYMAMPEELNLNRINQSLAEQKRLVLPMVRPKRQLSLHRVNDLTTLVRSKWGILEPNPEIHPDIHKKQIRTVLVPGLGFDICRNRLGRGGGYYDRLLPQLHPKKCTKIGIGFDLQYLSDHTIPIEPYDIKMDIIYTFGDKLKKI